MVETSDGRTIACFARTAYVGTSNADTVVGDEGGQQRKARSLRQAVRSTPGAEAVPTLNLTSNVEIMWALSADGDDT